MTPDRLLELLDAYLEGRLSDPDRAALGAELVASPQARRLFWECAQQHALLAEVVAEARGRRLAREELDLLSPPAPRRLALAVAVSWVAALAALVLLAASITWLLHTPPSPLEPDPLASPLAHLAELRGEVFVIPSGQAASPTRQKARSGQLLRSGEEVRTGEDGFAVVTYADSSRLELNADTSVRLLEEEQGQSAHPGKRIFLVEGVVNANVTPQPEGRPMRLSTRQADLLAPGTRFSSASVMGETRIEMEEGKATLSRKGDLRGIEIRTGTYAVASADLEVYHPVAMLPASTEPAAVLEESSGPVPGLAPLEQGKLLAVGCWNGLVKLWDVDRKHVRAVLDANRKRVLSLASALDGRTLAVGYESHPKARDASESVLIWDTKRQKIQRGLSGTRRAHALAFAPDGRSLAMAMPEKSLRGLHLFDLPQPRSRRAEVVRERLVLGDRIDRIQTLALSPDGQVAAAGCRDGQVRLWHPDTGRPLATLAGHQRDVQTLAFQPGGALLASGSRDGTIRLWNVRTGEEVRRLTGKFGEVRCLTFSPDGLTLVTGHAGVAILWNVTTGQQRTTLRAHKFAITALVYLHDGRTLATAGWDRTVKLWNLQPADSRL